MQLYNFLKKAKKTVRTPIEYRDSWKNIHFHNLPKQTTTADTSAPTVSSTSLSDSDTSVSVSSSISVTFSESMDTNSVTTNLSLTCDGGAIQVSTDCFSTCILMNSSLIVSNSNKTFAVTPIKPILMRNNFPLTYYAKQTISIRRIEHISIITSTITSIYFLFTIQTLMKVHHFNYSCIHSLSNIFYLFLNTKSKFYWLGEIRIYQNSLRFTRTMNFTWRVP